MNMRIESFWNCGASRVRSTLLLYLVFAALAPSLMAEEAHDQQGVLEITGTKSPYLVQFLVSGSDFLSIHGLTFDAQDNLYVGSIMR
jgi:hypothetical protein|tara:strand:- start:259 stop:519 length:261 start_codon:yes stop_codon:yes gene_type:complete